MERVFKVLFDSLPDVNLVFWLDSNGIMLLHYPIGPGSTGRKERRGQKAGTLGEDEQQMLAVARDIMAEPTVLIIEELSPFIRGFLTDRFGDGPIRLAHLSAGDVVRFVQRQAPKLHLKRAKLMTTALRSFLRYARYRGGVARDLAAAVPIVANWSMSSIPRAIGAEQIRQLLASIDRRTAIGRRDYAILLLLARLGLRSGEVAFFELDDIDWDAGQVSVRGKGGQRTGLPLPADVGAAIAAYLHHGRPRMPQRVADGLFSPPPGKQTPYNLTKLRY